MTKLISGESIFPSLEPNVRRSGGLSFSGGGLAKKKTASGRLVTFATCLSRANVIEPALQMPNSGEGPLGRESICAHSTGGEVPVPQAGQKTEVNANARARKPVSVEVVASRELQGQYIAHLRKFPKTARENFRR